MATSSSTREQYACEQPVKMQKITFPPPVDQMFRSFSTPNRKSPEEKRVEPEIQELKTFGKSEKIGKKLIF